MAGGGGERLISGEVRGPGRPHELAGEKGPRDGGRGLRRSQPGPRSARGRRGSPRDRQAGGAALADRRASPADPRAPSGSRRRARRRCGGHDGRPPRRLSLGDDGRPPSERDRTRGDAADLRLRHGEHPRGIVERPVSRGSSTSEAGSSTPRARRRFGRTSPRIPRASAASPRRRRRCCRQFSREREWPLAVLRLFSVFGPWETSTRFVPSAIRAALDGGELSLTPPGICRDFVFVDDVVEACLLAAVADIRPGEVINVGSGEAHANEEVVALVERASGRAVRVRSGEHPLGPHDGAHCAAEIQRARRSSAGLPATLSRRGSRDSSSGSGGTSTAPDPTEDDRREARAGDRLERRRTRLRERGDARGAPLTARHGPRGPAASSSRCSTSTMPAPRARSTCCGAWRGRIRGWPFSPSPAMRDSTAPSWPGSPSRVAGGPSSSTRISRIRRRRSRSSWRSSKRAMARSSRAAADFTNPVDGC